MILKKEPELSWKLLPRKFEEIIVRILDRQDTRFSSLTPASGDGGFDIYAARKDGLGKFLYLVECKRYVPPSQSRCGNNEIALRGCPDTESYCWCNRNDVFLYFWRSRVSARSTAPAASSRLYSAQKVDRRLSSGERGDRPNTACSDGGFATLHHAPDAQRSGVPRQTGTM